MSKKNIFIAVIAVLLVIALIGAAVFIFHKGDDNPTDTDNGTTSTEGETLAELQLETVKTEGVALSFMKLSASSPVAYAASGDYLSTQVTATVLPADAPDKTVDWSVEWASDATRAGSDVSEYVTVVPNSDGSNVATVYCHKAFTGDYIYIKVTTRTGGYTAECIVSFVGKPTDINVTSTLTAQSDGYHVGVGNTYTFNVDLSNPFGQVGSGFDNIKVELGAVGSMVLGYKEQNVSSGNVTWYDTSDTTVTLDSLKDKFITVNYANGVVTVNTLKSIESYYESMQHLDSGRTRAYTNAFKSYVTDCYFTVKITEQNSGLTKTFNIHFDDTVVTGVSTSSTEMTF